MGVPTPWEPWEPWELWEVFGQVKYLKPQLVDSQGFHGMEEAAGSIPASSTRQRARSQTWPFRLPELRKLSGGVPWGFHSGPLRRGPRI